MATDSHSLIVIGYGNPGRLDDGLGPAFSDRIEELGLPNVTVESNYQLTVEDAELIAKHDFVLFADAALNCEESFYVSRVEPDITASFCTHSVSPGQVYHLALSLFKRSGPREEIVAAGRFYYLEQANSAEVAFIVREELQGRGMAKHLLGEMMQIARQRGIASMQAYVRAENRPMLKVFDYHGFKRKPSESPREVILGLDLAEHFKSGVD